MVPFRLRIRGFCYDCRFYLKIKKLKKKQKHIMYFDLQTLSFCFPKKKQFLNLGDQNLK